LKLVFFGSSVPKPALSKKMISRRLAGSAAAGQREEYLLSVFKECDFEATYFLSTAFGSNNGPFSTETSTHDKIKYVLLGYIGGNKYLRYISSMVYALLWIMRNVKKGDVVVVYNFPIVYALPLLLKKIFSKYKLTIDFEDFYNKNDFRYYVVYPFESLGIRFAQRFIASSPDMAKHIHMRKKSNDAQVHVNGGYESSANKTNLKKVNNDYIQLLYSGSLDLTRGVMDLANAFSSNADERYRLVITGSGPLEHDINKLCEKDKRIVFKGNLNERDYYEVIGASDICINSQWESITINFPSKVTMYLSSGKYVLSTRHTALKQSLYSDLIDFYDQTSGGLWDKIYGMTRDYTFSSEEESLRIDTFSSIASQKRVALSGFINSLV